MITDRLIIIPFIIDFNWSADYQWQTAVLLAQKNTVVAYCEFQRVKLLDIILWKKRWPRMFSIRRRVYFYTPVDIFPFIRFSFIRALNSFINHTILLHWLHLSPTQKKIILWGFHPGVADTDQQFPYPHTSVYDCVDYYRSLLSAYTDIIVRQEQYIKQHFSVMTVNSKTLYDIHVKDRPDLSIVPLGFDPPPSGYHARAHKKDAAHPVIGYIGGLNYRLDFTLLHHLIQRNPKWKFVFWGPILADEQDSIMHTSLHLRALLDFPNVIHGRAMQRMDLFAVVESFDVAIIPYNTSDPFNMHAYPAKLMEYFYMGKPVVSTPITEVAKHASFVRIANDIRQWERDITYWLRRPYPLSLRQRQRRIATQNTWKKKIDVVSAAITKYERNIPFRLGLV